MNEPTPVEKVEELFHRALGVDPADREAFVRSAAGGDETLRQEVMDLLNHDGPTEALAVPPMHAALHTDSFGFGRGGPANSAERIEQVLAQLAANRAPSFRYRVLQEIGRGGMGRVHRVFDPQLRRHLAMKVIRGGDPGDASGPSGREQDSRALGRFLDEAQVTSQLAHPGIVPVHELGLDPEGRLYFTMQMVRGNTFRDVIRWVWERKPGWSQPRALAVAVDVCDALAYAHSKGVIHRDIKPDNVMVGPFGETYLMDWGVARILDQPDARDLRLRPPTAATGPEERDRVASDASPMQTMDGMIVGTLSYMPPEQARGEIDQLDPRSDVYSVGAMLYHLLTDHVPYRDKGSQYLPQAVYQRLLEGTLPGIPSLNPQVAPELVAICEKAMARDKQRRYPSTQELGADLRAYLEQRVVKAYRTGAVVELQKWVSRNRSTAAALLVALLVLIGGVITVGVKNSQLAIAKGTAEQEGARAVRNLEDRKRVSDLHILDQLEREARLLWPCRPVLLERMDHWIARAEPLAGRLHVHREFLELLRAEALPPDPDSSEHRTDFAVALHEAGHEEAHAVLQARIRVQEARLAAMDRDAAGRRAAEQEREDAQRELARLEQAIEVAIRWRFKDPDTQWWHDTLAELVTRLTRFAAADVAAGTLASVRDRRNRAAEIEEQTLGEYEIEWEDAIFEIEESAVYAGLSLPQQLGLVPLRSDPESGLHEFWLLESGEAPEVDPSTDRYRVRPETGIVLVLVPGGTFRMGCQNQDPRGESYDPDGLPGEMPLHAITLEPFFLSKYEMTQGQWERVTFENPSFYPRFATRDPVTPANPVENVSWTRCQEVLARLGLVLPTEAQWEYAARGGTTTPFWCGVDFASIGARNAGNLADQYARESGAEGQWMQIMDWNDGAQVHTTVGSYEPNGFGLHDVIGNVAEWCRDLQGTYRIPTRPGDGLRLISPLELEEPQRMYRGGSFIGGATPGRSAFRNQINADVRISFNGVRPARPIEGLGSS